ncbi:MAG: hypothetical protein HY906_04710 [Deltaproteobacteria bacterium]|nr:hypothetical protein [Deltaproteobacteria bacterium]
MKRTQTRVMQLVPTLTQDEQDTLVKCEAVVAKNLQAFIAVGCALREIQVRRLHRVTHRTFARYVRDRFRLSRSYAHRLAAAGSVIEVLSPIGDKALPLPTNESQVRPLVGLTPDLQQQAWQEAVAVAPDGPTAEVVRAVVARLAPKPARPAHGSVTPPKPSAAAAPATPATPPAASTAAATGGYAVLYAQPWGDSEHRRDADAAAISPLITQHAATDAVLFLRTPSRNLGTALAAIELCGFSVREAATIGVPDVHEFAGQWIMWGPELLLIAVRGDMPPPPADTRLPAEFPPAYPQERVPQVLEFIGKCYPDRRRIALFTSCRRRGWDGDAGKPVPGEIEGGAPKVVGSAPAARPSRSAITVEVTGEALAPAVTRKRLKVLPAPPPVLVTEPVDLSFLEQTPATAAGPHDADGHVGKAGDHT